MKRFPEKTVMAIIILSCGFLAQSEPSAGTRKAKPVEARPHQSQHHPVNAAAVSGQQRVRFNYARAATP